MVLLKSNRIVIRNSLIVGVAAVLNQNFVGEQTTFQATPEETVIRIRMGRERNVKPNGVPSTAGNLNLVESRRYI